MNIKFQFRSETDTNAVDLYEGPRWLASASKDPFDGRWVVYDISEKFHTNTEYAVKEIMQDWSRSYSKPATLIGAIKRIANGMEWAANNS